MGVMEIPNDSKVIRAPRRNTNTSAMVTKMEVVGRIVWARLAYRVANPPTMRAATSVAESSTSAKSALDKSCWIFAASDTVRVVR